LKEEGRSNTSERQNEAIVLSYEEREHSSIGRGWNITPREGGVRKEAGRLGSLVVTNALRQLCIKLRQ